MSFSILVFSFIIDLEFYNKSNSGLKRIKEISASALFNKLPLDINRKLISVFIAEVLLKVLVEQEKDEAMFLYAESAINELENSTEIPNTYPLHFLIKLSSYLGFYPSKLYSEFPFFDLQNGCFAEKGFGHNYFIKGEELSNFKKLLLEEKTNFSPSERKKILLILLDYYKLHHHEIKNLKSHIVIEQLRQ